MKPGKGFTLVEIMIVMAILVTLAVIAIPGFLRARVIANESSAIGSLRTISTGCESYRSMQNPPSYPPDLVTLSTETPPYVDPTLGGGVKQGYNFNYAQTGPNQYTCTAAPITANITGVRTFFVDESGVIRINDASGTPVE